MSIETIEEMDGLIEKNSLIAIDKLIEIIPTSSEDDVVELFNLFTKAILKKLEVDESVLTDNTVNYIFEREISNTNKRFIAVCLLRLFSSDDEIFEKLSIKHNFIALLDEVFSNDLYTLLKIEKKDQGYKKEPELKACTKNAEDELNLVISTFNSIDILQNFRQKFMSRIKSKLSQIIIKPFLNRGLLERLDELFSACDEYVKCGDDDKIHAFDNCIRILDNYLQDGESIKSIYNERYLLNIANKLKAVVKLDFDNSIFSKPAKIKIEAYNKKYPFYEEDREVNINILAVNEGPGCAYDVELEIASDLEIKKSHYIIGNLEPSSQNVSIPAKVLTKADSAKFSCKIMWKNYDKTFNEENYEVSFEGQKSNINWNKLSQEEPYSIEPVETKKELIGRKYIIDKLLSMAKAKSIGSAYIFGQKRVGKTSIVKTLKTLINKAKFSDYCVIYTIAGDFVDHNAVKTINNLGRKLCQEIKCADSRFQTINIPNFDGSLTPLSDFLQEVTRLVPKFRIMFIIDEFDELPLELYLRGSVGDAFFLTLRSISSKSSFGFLLVGSEKMEYIISCQGEKVNKFQPIGVDYFDKNKSWPEFEKLIREPISKWMEVTDEALNSIYEKCAGNPYFAKLICRSLFKIMVERKDSYITCSEVVEAMDDALIEAGSISFQHFWDDGIFETSEKKEIASMNNKLFLLTLAEAFREFGNPTKEQLSQKSSSYLDPTLFNEELRIFEQRKVISKQEDNTYKCKVYFFERWLKEKGISEIITTFIRKDRILRLKEEEEKLYVKPEEILYVANKWGQYKGKRIDCEKIRAWLNQFGDNSNQRLMFQLLENVKFYTNDQVRGKMKEAYGIIARQIPWNIKEGKQKVSFRDDILVSYLDGIGKSGPTYANIFADENKVFHKNVVEKNRIVSSIKDNTKAIVFIDDFIGTGDSAYENFQLLFNGFDEEGLSTIKDLRIIFVTISGYEPAKFNLIERLKDRGVNVEIHICDPLNEMDKCFVEDSKVFGSVNDREKAHNICQIYGSKLEKNAPLGYGDCQALVVFEKSCPNNTLPILWAKSNNWISLFPRL